MNYIKNLVRGTFFVFGILLGIKILKNRKSSQMAFQVEKSDEAQQKSSIIMKTERTVETLNSRQRKIMQLLQEAGFVEMKSLRKEFPSVTSRTLRRDLNKLSDENLINKEGSTKAAKYYLN